MAGVTPRCVQSLCLATFAAVVMSPAWLAAAQLFDEGEAGAPQLELRAGEPEASETEWDMQSAGEGELSLLSFTMDRSHVDLRKPGENHVTLTCMST